MRSIIFATAVLLATVPAAAQRHTLTLSGNIYTDSIYNSDHTDRIGLFGTPGRVMSGAAFQARFFIDQPQLFLSPNSTATTRIYVNGFNVLYALGDAITAEVVIDGRRIRGIGTSNAPYTPGGIQTQSQLAMATDGGRDVFTLSTSSDSTTFGNPMTLAGISYPASGFRLAGQVATNSINIVPDNFAIQPFSVLGSDPAVQGGSSTFQFAVSSLAGGSTYQGRIASATLTTAAIPEPASWAMLIAGFGLTGAAARRRRLKMPVVAA